MADEAATALKELNLGTASAKDKQEPKGRQRGSVRWFNASKGFGFIQPRDVHADASEGYDLFCHQTSIQSDGFRSLREGEPVEYDLEIGEDGRNKAVNVTGPNGASPEGAPKRIPVQPPRRHQYQNHQQLQHPLSPQHMVSIQQMSPSQQANALYGMQPGHAADFQQQQQQQQQQQRPYGGPPQSQAQQQQHQQQWPAGGYSPGLYSMPMQQQQAYGGSTAGYLGGVQGAEMQRMQAAMQASEYYGRRPVMPPSPLASAQWLSQSTGFGAQHPPHQQHTQLQQQHLPYGSNGRGRSGPGGVADRRPPPGTPGISSGLQVVVHNLPWNITEEQLASAFTKGGAPPVERAAIIVDSSGRSRGFGTVLFPSSAEAETAVEVMNNADVGGRAVTVRIDRFA